MIANPPPLSMLVNAALLVVLTGFLMIVGKPVMLPILAAVIAVYVLVNASEAMGKLPVVGRFPASLRRFFVLLIFTAAVLALAGVVVGTITRILREAPLYQANIERLVAQAADVLGVDNQPDWQTIRAATFGRLSVQDIISSALLNVTSFGASLFLVIVYSAFLLAERDGFAAKLSAAMKDPEDAIRTGAMIRDINRRIGDYLAVKTLINIILGAISFVILWAMDVDFPLFWALLIGLLNYIPYFGSLVAVAFPVLMSLLQFGNMQWTVLLAVLLTAAQMGVGNILEPRLIGRRVNLSPLVVLVSLAVWSALWGLPGALLAVPLTSMLTIVLSAFKQTQPFAILMADRVMDEGPLAMDKRGTGP